MTNRNAVLKLTRRAGVPRLLAWLRRASAVLVTWKKRNPSRGALGVLSPPEKALLRKYLEQDTRTLRAPTLAGAALGLEHAEIIAIYREPASPTGAHGYLLGLNEWALELLRSHPELVGASHLRLTRRRSVI